MNWKIKQELKGHTFGMMALAFHPKENMLVSAGPAVGVDELWCWDTRARKGEFAIRYKVKRGSMCKSLAFSPDGSLLVGGTTSEDICIRKWADIVKAGEAARELN